MKIKISCSSTCDLTEGSNVVVLKTRFSLISLNGDRHINTQLKTNTPFYLHFNDMQLSINSESPNKSPHDRTLGNINEKRKLKVGGHPPPPVWLEEKGKLSGSIQ